MRAEHPLRACLEAVFFDKLSVEINVYYYYFSYFFEQCCNLKESGHFRTGTCDLRLATCDLREGVNVRRGVDVYTHPRDGVNVRRFDAEIICVFGPPT